MPRKMKWRRKKRIGEKCTKRLVTLLSLNVTKRKRKRTKNEEGNKLGSIYYNERYRLHSVLRYTRTQLIQITHRNPELLPNPSDWEAREKKKHRFFFRLCFVALKQTMSLKMSFKFDYFFSLAFLPSTCLFVRARTHRWRLKLTIELWDVSVSKLNNDNIESNYFDKICGVWRMPREMCEMGSSGCVCVCVSVSCRFVNLNWENGKNQQTRNQMENTRLKTHFFSLNFG